MIPEHIKIVIDIVYYIENHNLLQANIVYNPNITDKELLDLVKTHSKQYRLPDRTDSIRLPTPTGNFNFKEYIANNVSDFYELQIQVLDKNSGGSTYHYAKNAITETLWEDFLRKELGIKNVDTV